VISWRYSGKMKEQKIGWFTSNSKLEHPEMWYKS
jgi:hypothetical protein